MTNFHRRLSAKYHQQGLATLTVVVLLLLILLLVVPFAMRMGVFEERTSINENRSMLASSVAEAALNQGTEFIKSNTRVITSEKPGTGGFPDGWLYAANASWQPCSVAVAATVFDPCLSEPDTTRRAQMYRFNRSGNTNLPLASQFGSAQLFTKVGGFDATYSVAATLCRIEAGGGGVGGAPRCALTPTSDGNVAITLVSQAALPTENATAQARQVIASFKVISDPPTVPIVAASTLKGLGSAEIVPNPNSGGAGVPLSIWSNSNIEIDSGGTFTTCHLGEFLTNYTSQGPAPYDGIVRCEGCGCKGLPPDKGLISGKDTAAHAAYEGIDIMDKDGNTNGDLPDTDFFPEEPNDDPNNPNDDSMFEYVMGTNTTDEGATSPRMTCVSDENPGGNCEDQFLIDLGAKEIADCGSLNASSSGLYWVHGDCSIGTQVGTPSNPIFIVSDGCMSTNGQMEYYGLIYMRGRTCTGTNAFKATGGGQVYGAVVIDAPVDVNGSVQFIYNEAVLRNLGNAPEFKRYGVVPGTWTDEACFDNDATPGNCKAE